MYMYMYMYMYIPNEQPCYLFDNCAHTFNIDHAHLELYPPTCNPGGIHNFSSSTLESRAAL